MLIARASGQPFETFLRERIFEPLGMNDTGFSVPATSIDRLATGYLTDPDSGAAQLFDEPTGGQWSRPPAFPSGGGGLVSTVDDYLAFAQMLLRQGGTGGERILSRPSVESMTTDQLTPSRRRRPGWSPGTSGQPRLGLRRGGRHPARPTSPSRSAVRLGRRHGHVVVQRPARGPDHDPDDPAGVDIADPAPAAPDFWTAAYQAIDD